MAIFHKFFSLLLQFALLIFPMSVFPMEQITKIQLGNEPTYVSDELLVKFKHGVAKTQRSRTISAFGTKELYRFGKQQRFSRIKLGKGQSIQQILTAYRADPNVEQVQPNYIYYAQVMPDDTDYNQLWGLSNSNGNDIDAELAWDHITNCNNVIVAVLDNGIDYTHQDLAMNMWDGSGLGFPHHGYDFVGESVFNSGEDNDPLPMGVIEDHGTHIAGTIAAVGDNAKGITGICWQAQIMSVRVMDSTGVGLTSSIIQGIEFAVDHGAKVINMSLGFQGVFDPAFSNAISYARDQDVVVVVAAGNEGLNNETTSFYPCNFTHPNLVCVAALDQNYELATFSNYGSVSVDLGAPGVDILSTVPMGQTISDPLTGWTTNNGNWATATCNFVINGSIISQNTLVNPVNGCNQTNTYAANADDRIYKTFDFGGSVDHAVLFYQPFIETQLDVDIFSSAFDSAGGDPFDTVNDIPLMEFSGTNDIDNFYFIHDLTACRTSTCTVGFRLTSDATIQLGGVRIPLVVFSTLEKNGNTYETFQGTSMVAPHVAGIAALVRAYNPNFTYADTIAALKGGGETVSSLTGITTTGKAANAMGSLSYINPPTGVVAVIQ